MLLNAAGVANVADRVIVARVAQLAGLINVNFHLKTPEPKYWEFNLMPRKLREGQL